MQISNKDKQLIEDATKHCRDSETYYQEARADFDSNMKFVELGEQWFKEDKAKRERNKRLMVVVNLLHKFVKHFTGILQQEKISVKITGFENNDALLAIGMDMIIAHIFNRSKARDAINMAIYYAVAGGFGFGRVVNVYEKETTFDQELRVEKILNPLMVYPCPHSTDIYMADQRKCVIITEVPRSEFEAEYGSIDVASFSNVRAAFTWANNEVVRIAEYFYTEPTNVELYLLANGQVVELIEDTDEYGNTVRKMVGSDTVVSVGGVPTRPEFQIEKQKTIKRNKVMWCKLTGVRVLSKPRKMACSRIPVFCCAGSQFWLNGKRYMRPLIWNGKDPARIFNFLWTTILEVAQNQPLAPFLVEKAQIAGLEDTWKDAQEKLLAYMPYNAKSDGTSPTPARQQPPEMPPSLLALLETSRNLIYDAIGYYQHQFGDVGERTSGKSLDKRINLANSGQYDFLDHLDGFVKIIGKTLVEMIPRTYELRQIERIVGYDLIADFQEKDKKLSQLLTDVSVDVYDMIIDASPAFASKREESLSWLLTLAQAQPNIPLIDLLAKLKDVPIQQELIDRVMSVYPDLFPDDPRAQAIKAKREQAAQMEQYKQQLGIQRDELAVEGKQYANAQRALKVAQAKTDFEDETKARNQAAEGMAAMEI